MKKLFLLFFITLLPYNLIGQHLKIDSLTMLLNFESKHSKRVQLLEQLSNQTINYNLLSSEKYAKKLIEESKTIEDSLSVALGYKLLGNVNHYKNEKEVSINYYRKGLSYTNSHKKSKERGSLLGSIGNLFLEKQQIDSAFVYWLKAKDIFENLSHYKSLMVLNFNFAAAYYSKGDYITTIKYLKQTEKYNNIVKSSFFEMRCHSLYGSIFKLMGRYQDSEDHLKKASKIATSNNYTLNIISIFSSLANLKAQTSKIEEAKRIYEKTNNIVRSVKMFNKSSNVLLFYIDYAFLLIELGETEKAVKIYKNNVKPYKKYLDRLDKGANLLEFFCKIKIDKKELKKELNKIYQSNDLMHKVQAVKLFSILFRANKDMPMLIQTQDSLLKMNKKIRLVSIGNTLNYTLKELGVERKEKENLELKQENTEKELALVKENKRKWISIIALLTALLVLLVFLYFFRKTDKQKKMIEKLQRELHHRIKNNLAIIDTFIDTAKDDITDEKGFKKLEELQNRIDSIYKVHELLYKAEVTITEVPAKEYITALVDGVQQSFSEIPVTILMNIDTTMTLNAEQSFPIGLIINEFLTNSYKYAFEELGTGKITIDISCDKVYYQIRLTDNGIGFSKDFDIDALDSFGIDVMRLLVEQLEGSFDLKGDNGVSLELQFAKK